MKDNNRWKQPRCSWSNSHGSSINGVSWRSLLHRQTRISRHLLEILQGAPPKRLCVFKAWPVSRVEMSSKKKRFVKPSHRFLVKQHHLLIFKHGTWKDPRKGKRRNIDEPNQQFLGGSVPSGFFQICILNHHHPAWCLARVWIQAT